MYQQWQRPGPRLQILIETLFYWFLLADGIAEVTINFVYLPSFSDEAKKNPAVGLSRALDIIVTWFFRASNTKSQSQRGLHDGPATFRPCTLGESLHHFVNAELWAHKFYRSYGTNCNDIAFSGAKIQRGVISQSMT